MLRKSLLLCLFLSAIVPAFGLTPVRTPAPKAEETLRRQIEHSLEFLRPVPSRWERLNEWVDAHRKEIMSAALGALLTWIVMRHQARAKSRKYAAQLTLLEDRIRTGAAAHKTELGAVRKIAKEKNNDFKKKIDALQAQLGLAGEKFAAEQRRAIAMDTRLQLLIQQFHMQAAQAAQLQASISNFGLLSPSVLDKTFGQAATPGSEISFLNDRRGRGNSSDSSSGKEGDELLNDSFAVSPMSAMKGAKQSGVVAVSPLTGTEQVVV